MISLLVPCHDAGQTLGPLFNDIRRQTVPFGEVLFFDDGSVDNTADLLRASGFRFLRSRHNIGPAAARNRLLAAASRPWVHFHDADDRLRPAFSEAFSTRLPPRPANEAWFCAALRRNKPARWEEETRYLELSPDTDWLRYHLCEFIHHNQIVFPRESLLRAGGYNESLVSGEDLNLHIRLAAGGMNFNYLDEVLVEQNCGRHAGLASVTPASRIMLDTLGSCRQIIPLLPPGHRRFIAPSLAALAVHFSSLRLKAPMREAYRLAKKCRPTVPLQDPRDALSLLLSRPHFPSYCEFRYLAIAMRDLMKKVKRRTAPLPSAKKQP